MKIKLNTTDFALLMSLFIISGVFFLSTEIKYLMIFIVFLYLISKYNQINKMMLGIVFYLIVVYSVLAVISTIFNEPNNVLRCIVRYFSITELFLCVYLSYFKNESRCINIIYYFTFMCLLINFGLIVFCPNGTVANSYETIYLFSGGKFVMTYVCVLWLCMHIKKFKYKYFKVIFGVLIALYTVNKMQCSSGLLAIILILLISYLPGFFRKIILSKKFILCLFAVLNFGIVITQTLLNNRLSAYIIEKILNKELSLTGRVDIYLKLYEIIMQNPLFGHGYDSNTVFLHLGYGNAQNGVINTIIEYGLFSAIILIMIIYFSLYKEMTDNDYIVLCLMVMLILSIVEITFSSSYFFITLAVISAINAKNMYKKKLDAK